MSIVNSALQRTSSSRWLLHHGGLHVGVNGAKAIASNARGQAEVPRAFAGREHRISKNEGSARAIFRC
jgi:hypothetical protein